MAIHEASNGVHNTNDTKNVHSSKQLAAEGSLPSSKTLYQGPKDNDKKWTWLDQEPKDVAEAAENEETAQHALITRLQNANDSRKKFQIHSIIIQSPWLKDALAEILHEYPGVHCGLKRLEFEAPFRPFVHRWPQLLEYRTRKDLNTTTAEHLELLYNVLAAELKDVIKTLDDYVNHGIVTYEHIWTIFQPGSVIYSDSHNGAHAAYTLRSGAYVETRCGNAYQLSIEAVDYNGTHFGRCVESIRLWEFIGTTHILGLSAFPLSFHPHQQKVKEALIARGKKFEQLADCHYRSYDGFAVTWDKEGNEVPYMCNGRIIVDSDSFRRFSPHYVRNIQPLAAKEGAKEPAYADEKLEIIASDDAKYVFGGQSKTERLRLAEEHHLICMPRVRGYSLKKKKWFLFYLDLIQEIKFNSDAFGSLVLPEDQKELILSFAESQAMNSAGFDDIISGKGRGHITLFSGPPGVGKTLTAESVAEHMRAPLFMMSAGDLGINPDQVEAKLTSILEMIAKWNAVLLLDECDVFLEARSTHDLERNKLVSIFLRVLEYYEGLLFLTTNRVDNIDPAFQSRIHVSMAYPDLTVDSRRHIWENFLKGLDVQHEWKSEDLDDLAEVNLNGRQIKNVLKSAALLAARQKDGLGRKYVDKVLAIERRRPGVAEGFKAK
ncbi:P-loop containing nucleoside triphosphate hydrolase protein [Plenodomus tracheiphilus IPT5]|uniref:P-loop containing nucleoside triphosphate hydrolase protein n=1 Tax=Plenodomus tracheiphilus IPT5 TaxID=1408161 RepID=A0A6A7B4P9_9PLEO|nr:P-loop containing nucleoside triphosphate hydrolase protein [Plenodomus tracheiphilus IPT5]